METNKKLTKISKFLSLILRHKPEQFGLKLDDQGWANVKDILKAVTVKNQSVTMAELEIVVATNEKKRFAFNDSKTKIRANQGHSIDIKIKYDIKVPPIFLFHGTATKNIDLIKRDGIQKMGRIHVHISSDIETAKKVGSRHGKPVVCVIESEKMHEAGYVFLFTDNKIWLTDHIPSEFIMNYVF